MSLLNPTKGDKAAQDLRDREERHQHKEIYDLPDLCLRAESADGVLRLLPKVL